MLRSVKGVLPSVPRNSSGSRDTGNARTAGEHVGQPACGSISFIFAVTIKEQMSEGSSEARHDVDDASRQQ